MPLINLIHEQRIAIRKEQSQRRTMLFGLLASGAIGLGAWGGLFLQTDALRVEKRMKEQQLEKMEPIMQAIEASQSQYNILHPRLTTLQDAASATKRWARVLDHVSNNMPEGVWLTAIRCSQGSEQEPVVVEVQGLGPTQEKISEFILRIQGTSDIEAVNLRYTQGEMLNEERAIKFEVSGNIAGTAKPLETVSEDKKSS